MDRKRTAPSRGSTSQPYREDCWSDGETSVLIDAWGDRYLELNRGNIPQKQWQEVADAVNSRPCDARRPPRTDIQCKYRVDTLKKKYKIEKNKIAEAGGSSSVSSWQFFDRLDFLIGSSFNNQNNYGNFNSNNGSSKNKNKPAMNVMKQPPLALPLPSSRVKGYQLPPPAAIARNMNENGYDSDSSFSNGDNSAGRKRPRVSNYAKKEKEEDVISEMSKAIEKMMDVYEKVEMEKGKQMLELEKQRMEFMKSIEVQRMQMVVDTMKLFTMKKCGKGKDDDSYVAALNLALLPKFFK